MGFIRAFHVLVVFATMATVAHAQQALQGDDLKAYVSGKNLAVGSDGIATYKPDGRYEYYVAAGGTNVRGKWSVRGDRLCVEFENKSNRCDQIVREGNAVYLRNSRGSKFPLTVR